MVTGLCHHQTVKRPYICKFLAFKTVWPAAMLTRGAKRGRAGYFYNAFLFMGLLSL